MSAASVGGDDAADVGDDDAADGEEGVDLESITSWSVFRLTDH